MTTNTARRDFLGRLAALGASIGLLPTHTAGAATAVAAVEDPWMKRVTGAHKVVFHSHMPTEGLAIRWAQTFLDTQKTAYGIREQDCTVIVGLNGRSIGWFFNDALWAKYPSIGDVMGMPGARSPMKDSLATLTSRNVILLACANSIRASGGRFLPADQRAAMRVTVIDRLWIVPGVGPVQRSTATSGGTILRPPQANDLLLSLRLAPAS